MLWRWRQMTCWGGAGGQSGRGAAGGLAPAERAASRRCARRVLRVQAGRRWQFHALDRTRALGGDAESPLAASLLDFPHLLLVDLRELPDLVLLLGVRRALLIGRHVAPRTGSPGDNAARSSRLGDRAAARLIILFCAWHGPSSRVTQPALQQLCSARTGFR